MSLSNIVINIPSFSIFQKTTFACLKNFWVKFAVLICRQCQNNIAVAIQGWGKRSCRILWTPERQADYKHGLHPKTRVICKITRRREILIFREVDLIFHKLLMVIRFLYRLILVEIYLEINYDEGNPPNKTKVVTNYLYKKCDYNINKLIFYIYARFIC